jgi:hypothetical protein
MSLNRILEVCDHCFNTLIIRQRELQMKVFNPFSVCVKPFSKCNLRPIFHRVCVFPIREEEPADTEALMECVPFQPKRKRKEDDFEKLRMRYRPISFIELNGVHYQEWEKRQKFKIRTNSKRRLNERNEWQEWKRLRDIHENEMDEFSITFSDFEMDFS